MRARPSARVLDRDPPLALLDEDDGRDDRQPDGDDDREDEPALLHLDRHMARGRWRRSGTKIRIDMPLPTPRSVMSSPSHMITACRRHR
jgi:hypothetical protein